MKEHLFMVYNSKDGTKYYLCWVDGTTYNCVNPTGYSDMTKSEFLDFANMLGNYIIRTFWA